MDIEKVNTVLSKAIVGLQDGEIEVLTVGLDEARKKKPNAQATMSAIKKVLDGAVGAYSKHFGSEVRVARSWQNFTVKKKGGNSYGRASLVDDNGNSYVFTVVMSHDGRIRDVYPEIRRASDDTTLAQGKKQSVQYSHESIPVEVFASPKKMFGSAKA